jgi:hypothetical protein
LRNWTSAKLALFVLNITISSPVSGILMASDGFQMEIPEGPDMYGRFPGKY